METRNTRFTSHSNAESALRIKIPPSMYELNAPKTQALAMMQDMVDLVGTIIEAMERLHQDSKIMECGCLLDQLEDSVLDYAGEINGLSTWNRDREGVGRAPNEAWEQLAGLLSPHLKLKRELRFHIRTIENVLVKQGEHLDIIKHLSGDAGILSNLGAALTPILGKCIDDAEDGCSLKCGICGKGTDAVGMNGEASAGDLGGNISAEKQAALSRSNSSAVTSRIAQPSLRQSSASISRSKLPQKGRSGIMLPQAGNISRAGNLRRS